MKSAVQRKGRHFQGIPVREARADILVQPSKADIEKSTRRDPENCAYAVCCRRMFQTRRAFVYSGVAYVEVLDETGHPIMERYVIRNSAKDWMRDYDDDQPVNPGGFVLHKPPKGYTLEWKHRYGKRWQKANPDKRKLYGQRSWAKQKAARKAPKAKQINGFSFRDGTGCVRFLGTHDGMITTRRE